MASNLMEIFNINKLNCTLKYADYLTRHIIIESLTKHIIVVPIIPDKEQIEFILKLYYKYIIIICFTSKDINHLLEYIENEYNNLWNIPPRNDNGKYDSYYVVIL